VRGNGSIPPERVRRWKASPGYKPWSGG
jgi:hypothetical protein